MKRLSAVIAMSSFLGFAVPAAAHDMAEGIVSDEIWTMINDLLEAVDSPHLDLDLSFITMDRTITTTVQVDTSQVSEEQVEAFLTDLLEGYDELTRRALDIEVTETIDPDDPDNTGLTVTITERIGAGESQVEPVYTP